MAMNWGQFVASKCQLRTKSEKLNHKKKTSHITRNKYRQCMHWPAQWSRWWPYWRIYWVLEHESAVTMSSQIDKERRYFVWYRVPVERKIRQTPAPSEIPGKPSAPWLCSIFSRRTTSSRGKYIPQLCPCNGPGSFCWHTNSLRRQKHTNQIIFNRLRPLDWWTVALTDTGQRFFRTLREIKLSHCLFKVGIIQSA